MINYLNKLVKSSNIRYLLFLNMTLLSFNSIHAQEQLKSNQKSLLKKIEKQSSSKIFNKFNKSILSSKYASWGVSNTQESINLLGAWKEYKHTKDVIVAVIDTGIDPSHPFLKDNLHTLSGNISIENFGVDFSFENTNSKTPHDSHGHGTHVAGIIKSVFPTVKILTLKYFNPAASGQANLESTISALKFAVDANVDVINYSGGGPEPSLQELRILKDAEKKGILVVAAAGNDSNNIDVSKNAYYPASYGLSNIITVTTHDQNLKILNSSNYGEESVDISAPGHRIKSALPFERSGYLTGTSQSTAFVSGVAAMIKSRYPQLQAKDLKDIITSSSKYIPILKGKSRTSGILDASKAMKFANLKLRTRSARKLATRFPNSLKKSSKIVYRMLPKKKSTSKK